MVAELPTRFTNEEEARKHLEALQWPEGPICPHCGTIDEASQIKGGRKGLWFCNACRKQFTVTVGTVMERSKVRLNTWLYAIHLLCSSKKGISSHQLSRMLGTTYKTAWFLSHRIREAMREEAPQRLGSAGGFVEADEMFTGVKRDMRNAAPGPERKFMVLSLTERGGRTRSIHVHSSKAAEVQRLVGSNISPDANLRTDRATHYRNTKFDVASHEMVNHSAKEYVRGDAHTNTLEGYFSVFKRGMVGIYQHCGEQHLHRYLAEFDFRQNTRAKFGIDDMMRADLALKGTRGKRLTYRKTTRTVKAVTVA